MISYYIIWLEWNRISNCKLNCTVKISEPIRDWTLDSRIFSAFSKSKCKSLISIRVVCYGPFPVRFWVRSRFWVWVLGSDEFFEGLSQRILKRKLVHFIIEVSFISSFESWPQSHLTRLSETVLAATTELAAEISEICASAESFKFREIFSKIHRYVNIVTTERW